MRIRIVLFVTLLTLTAHCLQAQIQLSSKSKKAIELYNEADNYRVRGQFDKAISLLKQALEKDKKFEEAYYRLGITYKNAGDLTLSNESLEKGLAITKDPIGQKIFYYQLGANYLHIGEYEKSLAMVDKFILTEKFDKQKIDQASLWKTQAAYGKQHSSEKFLYKVAPLSDTVNAFPMQYFPAITASDDELIYTVRMGNGHDDNEDIMISRKDKKGKWTPPVSVSDNINSDYREGACSISADGRQMILTICGPRGCDLFESKKQGDNWLKPISLGPMINSAGWEAQPSLSADGRELYFVSDRKGGLGGYDLWYSKRNELGKWTRAVNLGPTVNTRWDEIAPFIHVNNNNLYYASNGLPGYGGYDIYVSEKRDNKWAAPTDLGAPLNNYEDQYSFSVASDGVKAYFSKEEGKNKSRIYVTSIPEEWRVIKKGNIVKGIVRDSKTQKPLKSAVELYDLKTNTLISTLDSDSLNGEYLIIVPGKSEYALHVTKPGYLFSSLHFNYEEQDQDQPLIINLDLQPITKNAVTVLNNIFFDVNQYELKERSFTELDEIFLFLQNNRSVKVEISGHTDNTGAEPYNQQLSLKRAQSVSGYLIKKGIDASRIIQKGYGSQKPIKSNDTEDGRQANRRIEFRVVDSDSDEEASTPKNNVNRIDRGEKAVSFDHRYVRGPKGGCYYINSSGIKVYVDKSLCK